MTNHYLLYGSVPYALAILRPLQAAIQARGDQAAWFFDGDGADELTPNEHLLTTVEQVKQWNPIATFTSSNFLPHFFPGVRVQNFHGFNAGKSQNKYAAARQAHFKIRPCFDLYCTTGPDVTPVFQSLADKLGYFKVKETGWPKLDPLFKEVTNHLTSIQQPPVILYCSTFSPALTAAPILYEEIKRLSRKKQWRWIITFHPKMDPEIIAKYRALENDNLRFIPSFNIPELFSQADIMCCDTSSAISEFLLTGKPVVTFKNRQPGPQLINIDDTTQFEAAIEKALSRPPELLAAAHQFADNIHPYRDGCSSERTLAAVDEFIAQGGTAQLKAKPLDLWRKFKMRRRLGYWK